ncbi:MAG: preprotein translocase subunit SecG [Patescibacteria group bacterium]|nr:preprotein translocase subunit SecG [Patescibacteria group bacterium]
MKILNIIQIIIAIALMLVILLQNKGSGLSGIFGGGGDIFQTKRGMEKKLFYATIVISILFFVVSLATIINF